MNTFPRPDLRILPAAAVAASIVFSPQLYAEHDFSPPPLNPEQHITLMADDPALLTHSASGYLGVDIRDIDTERATQLKLKEARGAEIITIDHDAPACKAGLREHDVILSMNNQPVEGEAQLRRMLRETPPGRTVAFLISRDGQQQSVTVQLADRSTMESTRLQAVEPDSDDEQLGLPGGSSGLAADLFPTLKANPFYTGLQLNMLGPQLANFFGVHDGQGMLVERVDDNSPAALAGLRAGDVITRVNGQIVATNNAWDRMIRSNRGKQVQLTVVRDRRENTVNMTAGRAKDKGELDWPGCQLFSDQLALGLPPAELARQFSQSLNKSLSSGALLSPPVDPSLFAKQFEQHSRQFEEQMKQLQQNMKLFQAPDFQ